jgi:hypothetical protein
MVEDWELETLLALDGMTYELVEGYLIEFRRNGPMPRKSGLTASATPSSCAGKDTTR